MTLDINEDWMDMIKLLNEEEVKYMLVGGIALGVHGYVRATGDMDIWVYSDKENTEAIVRALKKFGAPMEMVDKYDFGKQYKILQIGVTPRRIDIITSIDGVHFDDAWGKCETKSINGYDVKVIGMMDLMQNKMASGRAKDLEDVRHLKRLQEKEALCADNGLPIPRPRRSSDRGIGGIGED